MIILLLALLVMMPGAVLADTFYLSDTNIVSSTLETLATSAPSSLDWAQGWVVATKTTGNYAAYRPDTTITRQSQDWGTEPSGFTGRGYRTTNTMSGSFSPGDWTLAFKVSSGSLYYVQTGYIKYRLWRSTNANGSGATQITPGWQSSSLISWTAANQTKTFSKVWNSATRVAMAGEYLFLEVEWACATGGGNNGATVYWSHNEGATESLTTPAFASVALSGAATLEAVTASGTMAERVAVSGAATLGNITSQITAERSAGNSLSADATLGAMIASGTAAEVVKLGVSPDAPVYDMGAYEHQFWVDLTIPTLTSAIGMQFPNDQNRMSMSAQLPNMTADATVNVGIALSVNALNMLYDMGAYEQNIGFPFITSEITMTTDFSTVSLSLSGNLANITANIPIGEGAGMSLAGITPKTAANILMAEIVSNEFAADVPKLTSQIDMIGDPNQPFINPIPGMSLGLTPTGGNNPKLWRRR